MNTPGKVYLIPAPLYPDVTEPISEWTQAVCGQITHFYVENVRTARRVLKRYDPSLVIDDITFEEINHRKELDIKPFTRWIREGKPVGIMSEAGMPAIADPGHVLVAEAHRLGAQVLPMTGPNSILLALSASGLSGQTFTFHGYLPIQAQDLYKKLHSMEAAIRQGYTQVFIETPFRNMSLIRTLTDKMPGDYRLCIACDLTSGQEYIKTQSVREWKGVLNSLDFHKRPAIFLLAL